MTVVTSDKCPLTNVNVQNLFIFHSFLNLLTYLLVVLAQPTVPRHVNLYSYDRWSGDGDYKMELPPRIKKIDFDSDCNQNT